MRDRATPVLMVIDSLATGGAQRHLLSLCGELNRGDSGYAAHVFALTEKDDFFSEDLRRMGSSVVFGAKTRFGVVRMLWRLWREMRSGRFAVVHSYLPAAYLLATPVARLCGIRAVFTTVCARRQQISSPVLSFRNYGRLQRMTAAYFTAWPAQLIAVGVPPRKIRYALFANDYQADCRIAIRERNPLVARYGLAGAYPILLAIGRLHPDKGHHLGIEACKRLAASYPDSVLLILGAGEQEARLKALTEGKGPRIVLCGLEKDLVPFFSIADLYLNTAVNEGINLSQLQAMAFGIPTFAFDTGISEYEAAGLDSAVVRVALGDVAALAGEMESVLANEPRRRRLAESGRAFAALYDKRAVVRAYAAAYDEMTQPGLRRD